MHGRTILRLAVTISIIAGVLSVSEPAFALTSAPDSTWSTNGKVYTMARSGNIIYVGGKFTKVKNPGGQLFNARNVAAFDTSNGAWIPGFSPDVDNTVDTTAEEVDALAVSVDGAKVYIGGKFDTVNGSPRENFAAVDAATGQQLDPAVTVGPNLPVNVIVAGPDLVYFGGNFTKVDGLTRDGLAAISASTGLLSNAWVPSATAGVNPCPSLIPGALSTECGPKSDGGSGNIHSMVLSPDGNSLYVGGNFFYINGVPRNALAQVSAVDGSVLPWQVRWDHIPGESATNPYQGPNVVWSIVPNAALNALFIGYGRTPNGVVRFSMTSSTTATGMCSVGAGCATRVWSIGTSGNAESLAYWAGGNRLIVGGHMGTNTLDQRFTGSPHNCPSTLWFHGLFSVNPATGQVFCDWAPQIIPFGGQSAPEVSVCGSVGCSGNPNAIGSFALQITNDALFSAGYFTSVSGVAQQGFARYTLVGSAPPPLMPPTIGSFTPTSGQAGSSVVITGTGFTGASQVTFGSLQGNLPTGVPATSYTVDSPTQITAVVPSGFTSAKIAIMAPGGSVASASNFQVAGPPVQAPTVSSISPTQGPAGTPVTVTGSNFTGITAVKFGSVPAASYTVDSPTQITAVAPSGLTKGKVKVTNSGGTGTSSTAFKLTAPGISGLSPNQGPVGSAVVISGSGLQGSTAVRFNGVDASFTVDSDTQITTTVPTGATTGTLTVTTLAGVISGGTFTVAAPPPPPPSPPAIDSFSPMSGPVGTLVTVLGSGFTGATSVAFGSIQASFTVDSDTQITLIVPSGFSSRPIKVTTPVGSVKSADLFTKT
jgi:hypothetical protein